MVPSSKLKSVVPEWQAPEWQAVKDCVISRGNMTALNERIESYRAYHQDVRNRLTHFLGIPLVTFALLIPLGWFRLIGTDIPVSAATVVYLGVIGWFMRMNLIVGLLTGLWLLPLLIFADEVSLLPWAHSALIFLCAFALGSFFQLLGHHFEKTRPAFMDNVGQVFNAPLFITVEVLSWFRISKPTPSDA